MITKLYCFVDETGQDTKGELFLVAVVIKEIAQIASLEKTLAVIEKSTGKKQLKWRKTHKGIKKKYFEALLSIKELKKAIYYATYQSSKEYSKLTSLTIAKAVLAGHQDQ